ncbi:MULTISPECIES: hypothetical protein [Streptosporangium]|uniref:Uncharacterized protein n=1 Tax=Streptosporangium brasiliense TaxID=47480 RepID=A0ABT9RIC9_9ACTN|nr:hypothetical protein [Streptosporangium brasiliense]MDP9869051.1 hypothetical protein [Streptosporangium brasiliense]
MKIMKLLPALAASVLALSLTSAPAQASAAMGYVVAVTVGGGSVYGEAHLGPSGGQTYLKVQDFTELGNWRIRGSIEKYYRGEWVQVVACTAKDTYSTTCYASIPVGTLVRSHVWAFLNNTVRYHGYSPSTRV